MTVAISRQVVLFVATAVSGVLLAGCGSGPNQFDAAAAVGAQSVPLDSAQQEISTVLAKEPQAQSLLEQHKFDQYARKIVANQVQHLLVQEAVQREGITVDAQQVNQTIAGSGGADNASKGTIYTPDSYRTFITDTLLESALGQKYASRLSVTIDVTTVLDRNAAKKMVTQIAANPDKRHDIMTEGSADDSPPEANKVVSVAASPQTASYPFFGATPGTVVAFPLQQTSSMWMVAYVVKRDVATAIPANQPKIDQKVIDVLGQRLLGFYAQEAGVTINPRYGVWDPIALTIAPSQDETFGIQLVATKPAS